MLGWVQQRILAGGTWFQWKFLCAKVAFPTLGADFLQNFDLWVDLRRSRLLWQRGTPICLRCQAVDDPYSKCGILQAAVLAEVSSSGEAVEPMREPGVQPVGSPVVETLAVPELLPICKPYAASVMQDTCVLSVTSSTRAVVAASSSSTVRDARSPTAVEEAEDTCDLNAVLEEEFPVVFNTAKGLPPVKYRVEHHIVTDGRAVAAKYRRLDAARLKAAKAEFAELERQGVIRRSNSHWASALHLVKKADGSRRPCEDFSGQAAKFSPSVSSLLAGGYVAGSGEKIHKIIYNKSTTFFVFKNKAVVVQPSLCHHLIIDSLNGQIFLFIEYSAFNCVTSTIFNH